MYDSNFISEEVLTGLQNVMPTAKERVEFAEAKLEADENWTLADRFTHFACKLDSLPEKIESILFKFEYENTAANFFNKLAVFVKFYEELHGDAFFHCFLEYFLKIGNFLNAGTPRGNAKAFKIENIDKSYLLIGQDK